MMHKFTLWGCFISIVSMYGTTQSRAADPIQIKLEVLVSGLTSPVALTHAHDGSGRLFVADQAGFIRVIDHGVLLPTPFLDLSAKIPALGTFFDERGVLGVAFHPNYATNGRFFVRYSTPRTGGAMEPCTTSTFNPGCHAEVLAEYRVSATDPNVANPASEIILLTVDEPQFNHDAGAVTFGPDGFLYFGFGDGGGANDGLDDPNLPHGPEGNGQNINTLLGSMNRIDVDSPPAIGLSFAIPVDNPFVGSPGRDEIYAYGFRNPFSFSFDDGPDGDGRLYVADVGQDVFEEVDNVVKGGNYGWVIREGAHCFDPFATTTPPATCATTGSTLGDSFIDPVSEYTHADGGLSVISGSVYRGNLSPELVGEYIYGDFSANFGPTGRLYYFDLTGPDAFVRKNFFLSPNNDPFGQFVKGFGEGEDGEVYVLASDELAPIGASGIIYHIVSIPTGACCQTVGCTIATQADCASFGGIYNGDHSICLGDTDGDGVDSLCESCPNDPAKIDPGICGCGVSDSADADLDGVPDCIDQCPGLDDKIDLNGDGTPDRVEHIPTMSQWGLAILTLMLLVGAKIIYGRSAGPYAR